MMLGFLKFLTSHDVPERVGYFKVRFAELHFTKQMSIMARYRKLSFQNLKIRYKDEQFFELIVRALNGIWPSSTKEASKLERPVFLIFQIERD